ncbi:MAG: T9SS type A sorting domain-containing protein [Candidatus Marinimicrobia bacterium]|nr:T9SS type A sorting domain-containing protein [Candidatus Neomarinimicrobiota bacterium]
MTDLLRGDRRRAKGKAMKERRPVSSSATSPGRTAAPVWRLLHTDPEEAGIYDIQSVYGGVTSDEILIKLESYTTVPSGEFSVIIVFDADQDTSTGLIIEEFYGWRLGIDYLIVVEPLFEIALLRWEMEEFVWADSLTSFSAEPGSYELIMGVDRAHFEAFPAVNFAVLAFDFSGPEHDQVPDSGQGHIVFPLAPPWLRLSALEGLIAAGSQEELTVTFDAEGLFGGDYRANIVVTSNDPAGPRHIVPAQLAVTGIPRISIEADFVDFGASFVGYLDSVFLRIDNVGTDVLEITAVVSGSPQLTAVPASLSIPPLASDSLRLYLLATTEGIFYSTITLVTNDPDSAEVSLPVYSVVAIAPDISLTPNEVLLTARPDSVATALLTLANTGGSNLSYTLSVVYPDEGAGGGDLAVLAQGGPDAFGYRWKDSNEPGGPAFEWIDNTGATPLSLDNFDFVVGIPLGFDFSYYGATFSQINIMSNGWVSFTSYDIWFPGFVPDSAGFYTGAIAPFAGDLFPPGGEVWYKTEGTAPNRVFVVGYNYVPWCCSGPPDMTFEVVFYESGDKLRFQYLDLQGQTPWAIGIASPDNSTGLGNGGSGITYIDPAIVGDNYALEFSARTEWLIVAPQVGSVPIDGSVEITLTADISELELGSYSAQIMVSSNDPDEGLVVVPVTLSVTLAVEGGQALPQSFALHQNYPNPFNPSTTLQFDLPMATDIRIVVYDLLGREVVRLMDQRLEPGYHQLVWNGRDRRGRSVPTGMYIVLMATPEYTKSIKLVLLK